MSVKDNCNYKTLFHDYDIFKDCFGKTRIMPTDIDGIVERNNNFLIFEFKPFNKTISIGQNITLNKLAMLNGFTVVVFFHKPCEMHVIKEIVAMKIYPHSKIIDISHDKAIDFVSNWFKYANNK